MTTVRKIIVEMRESSSGPRASAASAAPALVATPGVQIDTEFAPVPVVDAVQSRSGRSLSLFDDDDDGEGMDSIVSSTYIMRASVDPSADPEEVAERLKKQNTQVVEVFSDVAIQPAAICPGDGPAGSDADVEALLAVPALRRRRLDGSGVMVAIVDTGINLEYLRSRGKNPRFNKARSWVPAPGLVPGELPVDHGTMCAYDACIAAPNCTLLDIALLQSTASGGTIMEGFLSDGVRAYRHLLDIMLAPRRPGDNASLVVNNSWGMFHPSWDFPIGHPGNYSDNPNHPFNRIVGALARAGADILFAAGNCGADCPDGRCQGVVDRAIYGANSHPAVLSVAGVDVTKLRVGYSTIGPGRLSRRKPDLCGYTHFAGSGVYAADGGTSAATPVVAGVVAALRTRFPYRKGRPLTTPARVRHLLRKTAEDVGLPGYDFAHGYGIVNGRSIARLFKLSPAAVADPRIAAETASTEGSDAELSVEPRPLELEALLEHEHPKPAAPQAPAASNGSGAREQARGIQPRIPA
jgi:subtilisin family serine protease